jgi:hypothetical protein
MRVKLRVDLFMKQRLTLQIDLLLTQQGRKNKFTLAADTLFACFARS